MRFLCDRGRLASGSRLDFSDFPGFFSGLIQTWINPEKFSLDPDPGLKKNIQNRDQIFQNPTLDRGISFFLRYGPDSQTHASQTFFIYVLLAFKLNTSEKFSI